MTEVHRLWSNQSFDQKCLDLVRSNGLPGLLVYVGQSEVPQAKFAFAACETNVQDADICWCINLSHKWIWLKRQNFNCAESATTKRSGFACGEKGSDLIISVLIVKRLWPDNTMGQFLPCNVQHGTPDIKVIFRCCQGLTHAKTIYF